MGSKTRLSSYCTKRGNNTVNLVTSRKINTRLARPIANSRYIEGEVPGDCTPNCAIIVRADPGTCNILLTMHCKSVKINGGYLISFIFPAARPKTV